jgi:Flp pilus assembly protein TadB
VTVLIAAALAAVAAALASGPPTVRARRFRPARAGPVASDVPGGTGGSGAGRSRGPSLPLLAGVAAGLGVALLVPGPVAVPAGALAGLLMGRRVGRLEPAAVRRRRRALERGLPHVVDLMSALLASGAAPSVGLARVVAVVEEPLRGELASYVARLRLGRDPVSVWSAMAEHPQLGALGRALHRATQSGASVSDALSRLADDLRARRRADVEGLVRTVEVRATAPLGACLLPAFVLVGVVPLVAGSVGSLLLR